MSNLTVYATVAVLNTGKQEVIRLDTDGDTVGKRARELRECLSEGTFRPEIVSINVRIIDVTEYVRSQLEEGYDHE